MAADSNIYFEEESFASEAIKLEFGKRLGLLKDYVADPVHFSPGVLNFADSNLHSVLLAEFAAWAVDLRLDGLPSELIAIGHPPKAHRKARRESPVQRCNRLAARVAQEKAKGTRNFLEMVAREEGISTTRLKQILRKHASATGKPVSKLA